MQSAFVTGAGGFLGMHLVAALQADGVAVRALAHSADSATRLRGVGVTVVEGDLGDAAALTRALAPAPDTVFHVAADTTPWHRLHARQYAVNVDGTAAVLAAAIAAGVPRFVHTSSVAVYGLVEDRPIDETLPRLGIDGPIHYAHTKALAEAQVLAADRAGRIGTAVLQPGHILGPGDRHNWSRLARLLAARQLPGAPPGIGCFADVRAVARAHVAAARDPRRGECWLLGGVEAPFAELVQALAAAIGVPAPRRHLPRALLTLNALIAEARAAVTGREPAITRAGVALTCHRMRIDDRKARRELGYTHTPLVALASDSVVWLRGEGLLPA
ncbi:MAG: NAD-dependent epimerase/dehydratase family protein [Xanthomonadaceae bacterium]|nr:NAD-dependent epimerase/dehydratase family protein [Xanthomonadaceae bacterium]